MKLQVENGGFAYGKNGRNILENVNFSAGPGDILAILGPNGAGKTTLLRCTMGLLRWRTGRTLLDGKDLYSLSHRELWRQVAYVPQARNVTAVYTTEEMILLGRSSHFGVFGQPGPEDIELTMEVMERLHISRLKGKKCSQISGGELQMVLIARALATQPQALILDEPESNLDFRNQLLIMETLSQLAAEGMTCVFNTHYPAHAMQRANRALLLSADGTALFGDSADVVTEENIQRAFGVRAVIGEIETPEQHLKDIVPLSLAAGEPEERDNGDRRSLAVVSILTGDLNSADRINALLHEYSRFVVGRMGMPYPDGGVHIITVTLDAPERQVKALESKLGVLPGVSVKATFAANPFQDRGERNDES